MSSFRLPDVGEGLESAEIVEWLVTEGQEVERDQPLVEILTDKSQTQLPSPRTGVISKLGFAEGDMAEVGQVLVEFSDETEATQSEARAPAAPSAAEGRSSTPDPTNLTERSETGATQSEARAPAAPSAAEGRSSTPDPTNLTERSETGATQSEARAPASGGGSRPKAAPVVRRRALEAGLDLATVTGTGPGGRITNADLDLALSPASAAFPTTSAPAATAPAPTSELSTALVSSAQSLQTAPAATGRIGWMETGTHPLRGIRRVTAQAMERSWTIPHIHGNDELDATELLQARKRMKERDPEGAAQLTPLAFFVLAVANGLRRFPLLNGSIDPEAGTITVHNDVNVGIAVASPEGLSVPVIRNADQRSLFNLAAEIARLSAAVRDRTVTTAEFQGGTATISNYGSLGGRFATPIIRAPEVAIVGFGSIKPRPFVVEGEILARPTLPLSIAVDHRLIDGDLMTAFQEYLIEQLSDPVSLLAR